MLFKQANPKVFKTDTYIKLKISISVGFGMIKKKNPLNKQYSLRTERLNPFSKLAAIF